MRSIFEYMASIFLMMVISLVLVSLLSISVQIVAARNYHTSIIEKIQNEGDYENINEDDLGSDISIQLQDDNTLKVVYSYRINTPFFGEFETKELVGYAR